MRSDDGVTPLLLAVALALPGVASANPFPKADPAAGKRSFEEAKCNACHDKMTGGNGSRLFTRPDRKLKSAPALLKMVRFCIDRTGASVFPEDVEHIAAYLNQRFYKFD